MYAKGQGVAQDHAQAVEWYQKAAQQGYAHAQTKLGLMYAQGLGVEKDEAQARLWLEKSAAQGHNIASAALGTMYATGMGTTQDLPQAKKLLTPACENDKNNDACELIEIITLCENNNQKGCEALQLAGICLSQENKDACKRVDILEKELAKELKKSKG